MGLQVISALLIGLSAFAHTSGENFVQLKAKDRAERSRIVNLGVSIDAVMSDSVYATVSDKKLGKLRANKVEVIETFKLKNSVATLDFPSGDSRFHDYARMTKALDDLVANHPRFLKKWSIGKTVQGRDIWVVQFNTAQTALGPTRVSQDSTIVSAKPGVLFLGNHHAREHVSAEIPLMLLEHLAKNYGVDREITALMDKRDVYFIPMVNPDGVEFDIESGKYRWQRKNMNLAGGVDLNRNYGYKWGGAGASDDPEDQTYRGAGPFSEPETKAIKNFIESKVNIKTLLTYHTFSELILYPWGHTDSPISNKADRDAFVSMARRMAEWNKYKPEQSSELYISCGDTTDWAYGERGIFGFTFELSPNSLWGGGFYPGAGILDKVFDDNLKPALYLIELADDPHRAVMPSDERASWLD